MTGVGAQPALKCMFIIYVIFLALLGGVDVCGKIVREEMLSKVGVIEA
jgi:hypothetical protein